ncbi:MAG: hypothetical protein H6983_03825 [Ectothiorhodospiraceae bacterium]|nr:hypothetical protein [Chromatiales bacterium]MCP5153270.1 hypothetical protein [Ectothiorhodospiraceae bacterium]
MSIPSRPVPRAPQPTSESGAPPAPPASHPPAPEPPELASIAVDATAAGDHAVALLAHEIAAHRGTGAPSDAARRSLALATAHVVDWVDGERGDTSVEPVLLVDDLRALRKAPLCSTCPLFALPEVGAAGAESTTDVSTLRRMRAAFQAGLVDWLRGRDGGRAAAEMARALDGLARQASVAPASRAAFALAAGLCEALADGGLAYRPGTRALVVRVDALVRDVCAAPASVHPETEGLRAALWLRVASARSRGPLVEAARARHGASAARPPGRAVLERCAREILRCGARLAADGGEAAALVTLWRTADALALVGEPRLAERLRDVLARVEASETRPTEVPAELRALASAVGGLARGVAGAPTPAPRAVAEVAPVPAPPAQTATAPDDLAGMARAARLLADRRGVSASDPSAPTEGLPDRDDSAADALADQALLDQALVDNLALIAREMGDVGHRGRRRLDSLRDGLDEMREVIRGLRGEVEHARAQTPETAGAGSRAEAALDAAGIAALARRIERLTCGLSDLAGLHASVSSLADEAGSLVARQARQGDALAQRIEGVVADETRPTRAVLAVWIDGVPIAIPVEHVESVRADGPRAGERVVRLALGTGSTERRAHGDLHVALTGRGGGVLLAVDAVGEQLQARLMPLPHQVRNAPGIAGVAVAADDAPRLVPDLAALLAATADT